MLHGLAGRVSVVTHGGTNAGKFAGGDGDTGPAATDDDTAIDLTIAKGIGDRFSDVRVVDGGARMGPQVENFMSLLGQNARQVPLHFKTGVIRPNRNAHG